MSDYNEEDDELVKELNQLMKEIENLTYGPDRDLEGMESDGEDTEQSMSELHDFFEDEFLKVKLPFKKLHPDAVVPNYAYELDSGFDLYSTKEVCLSPFERALVPTGLAFEVPDGAELQIRSKSGLAINQGLMVLNSPGTVDCGYLGEIKVIVMNMSNLAVTINKHQKVAQGVLCPVFNGKKVSLVEQTELGTSLRGDKGFGSTGII